MAAVVALMAKDKGTPAIKFQALLWPVTDASFETASYKQFAEGHFLARNMMKWFWDNYTTDAGQRNEIYASPLRATPALPNGHQPAPVPTADHDVLRDDADDYARNTAGADVPGPADHHNGKIHEHSL